MANVNRHVKWPFWPVAADVRGSTVIEKGDLLFLDGADGLRNNGSSSANSTVYPFELIGGSTKTLASNQNLAADNFLGVAMYNSFSGVTELLAVATNAHFKFPLKSPKTYSVAETVMPTGSGTSLFNQKVVMWASGSTYPLGYSVRNRTRGSNVVFLLRPAAIGKKIS